MKAKEVLQILGISRVTLMTYVKNGYITGDKQPNGQYFYDSESVFKFIKKDKRQKVVYARVSTHKQKRDLNRQIRDIKSFCLKNKIKIDNIYSEISNGIDLERDQFSKLLDDALNYKISEIYITQKDRLAILSFATIEQIFEKFGTKIIVIDSKHKNDDSELFQELISLMHIFSTKMYSNRRKQKLDVIQSDLNLEFQKY